MPLFLEANFSEFITEFENASEEILLDVQTEVVKALTQSAISIKASMVNTSPRWTGHLANSHFFVVDKAGLSATIYNTDAKKAIWLEEGTHHTKAPRPEHLELWVQRKLGVPKEKALGVAYVIARSIKRKGGLKARHWMQKAFTAGVPKCQERIVQAMANVAKNQDGKGNGD